MQLKCLQVSGFKSFVDPTTVTVPGSIVAIVGPNGCGKSNVIDAVRWVMGESSPRNLRGDSMADVIFNGSTARNPVGKASVELVFDNSEGKAPGPYGQYAEISVKRSLSRDGQSDYFINRAKCRRRDITDIFLGTGLGPRSYSIIEQGMVSRIIEAKPEDLRSFVDEAAGISKFKDRRRETENRIRHTRENLSRIEDIRSELDALLRRLQRQSQAARRYKILKQEERLLQAQLGALHWRQLDENISQYDRELAKVENHRQIQISKQREVESNIESGRSRHAALQDGVNQVQGTLYSVGGEIASIEQGIEHAADTRRQREQERQRLVVAMADLEQQRHHDQQCLSDAESQISRIAPNRSECSVKLQHWTSAYEQAESEYRNWQTHWELFSERAATPVQESEVQKSRIVELERHVDRLVNRADQITDELKALDNEVTTVDVHGLRAQVQRHDQVCGSGERVIDELDERLRHLRELSVDSEQELEAVRDRHQELSARLGSLNELQAAALGGNDERATSWLRSHQLDTVPRLASCLRVTPGWEHAVDRVTNGALAAVCVDRIGRFAAELDAVDFGMILIEEGVGPIDRTAHAGMLLQYIEADGIDLAPLLEGVYAVANLRQGLALRPQLAPHECAVTRAGTMIGPNWISLAADVNEAQGVLAREHEIEQLSEQLSTVDTQLRTLRTQQSERQDSLAAVEEERAAGRRKLTAELARQTELHSLLGRTETRAAQIGTRQQQIRTELGELETQLSQERGGLQAAQQRLHAATEESGSYADQRTTLLDDRERLRAVLESSRQNAEQARDARHEIELQQQRLESALEAARTGTARVQAQQDALSTRLNELSTSLDADDRPDEELRIRLESCLQQRVQVEQELAEARNQVLQAEQELGEMDRDRLRCEQVAEELRGQLEMQRMERQELVIRRENHESQVTQSGFELRSVLEELPEQSDAVSLADQLDKVTRRIDRIGPVNLVAIEEFEEQSERKSYLDRQNDDLSQALLTLENVIRKIDRETRSRFKDTFDSLNQGFQDFFPRLFGGGSAYLDLTGDDFLETGVSVMARPPGKRNSIIQLLSGGEKALTAVALLFALFRLNPAPFCLLDEVDAPLDDANVERYCETLKTLSEHTQLIVITHNKITMEAADVLIGVTMAEPGVSRIVAVDVNDAVAMAG